MLNVKSMLSKIATTLAKPATVIYSAQTNAPSTQNSYNSANLDLTGWRVVSVRCRCYNVTEQLIFVRGTNAESYLTFTDSNGTVYRGGYMVDWTNGALKVRWTSGGATNVYAEAVRGII